jgi:hypothetical protein
MKYLGIGLGFIGMWGACAAGVYFIAVPEIFMAPIIPSCILATAIMD